MTSAWTRPAIEMIVSLELSPLKRFQASVNNLIQNYNFPPPITNEASLFSELLPVSVAKKLQRFASLASKNLKIQIGKNEGFS